MRASLLVLTSPGVLATVIDFLIVIGFPFWLWSAIKSGELRWYTRTTRRDDAPEMFWIGCAAIVLIFGAGVLALVNVISRHTTE